MEDLQKRQLISGVALMAIGGVMYFVLRAQDHVSWPALLVMAGSAFVAAYLYTRNNGYVVPGCILIGYGLGRMVEGSEYAFGDPPIVGLGAAFVAMYLIPLAYERKSHWWPLIPGSVLLLFGLGFQRGLDFMFENWPLALVLVGLLMVIGAFLRGRISGRREPRSDG